MSMELYVFLNKADMLLPTQWQQAIDKNGFELKLDPDFDQFTFTGFLPCNLEDRSTGFEYYFSPKEDVAPSNTYLAPLTALFDSVVSFVWGGDLREMCAVMMAAGALAASLPSWLYFAEDDSSIPGIQALAYARQQIAEARKYLTA